jgi:hypothetical protein
MTATPLASGGTATIRGVGGQGTAVMLKCGQARQRKLADLPLRGR